MLHTLFKKTSEIPTKNTIAVKKYLKKAVMKKMWNQKGAAKTCAGKLLSY